MTTQPLLCYLKYYCLAVLKFDWIGLLKTIKYANLANFIALLGGKIKSEQMISGNMADILSNIYLAESIIWHHNNNGFIVHF